MKTRLIVIMLWTVINLAKVYGYSFVVKCTYTSATASTNLQWIVRQTVPVTVYVENEKWKIQAAYDDGVIDYYGCNGSNVFRMLYDPKGPTNSLPGLITEDDYPADASPCITIPWLAFCSSKRLDQELPIPAPWALARETPLAYLYNWQVERFQAPPALPSHIKFMTDLDKQKNASRGVYLRREDLDKQAQYVRSFDYFTIAGSNRLGAEYVVLSKTNYQGMEIPNHAQLTFYNHLTQSYNTKGFVAKPKIQYELVVESVMPLDALIDFLPTITSPIDIVDYRVRDDKFPLDYTLYSISNKTWPIDVTLDIQNSLNKRREHMQSIAQTISRVNFVRPVLIGLLLLLIILPPAMMVFWRRNKQKAKTK